MSARREIEELRIHGVAATPPAASYRVEREHRAAARVLPGLVTNAASDNARDPAGAAPDARRADGDFGYDGIRHRVFERGDGSRTVVLLHELEGLSESCLRLGGELAREGFHVFMPVLYGRPGDASIVKGMLRARFCLWRELRIFSSGRDSPIATWLRALCRDVATRTESPRVAVIGMCMTGGLALAALAEPAVGAAVASQPSLPFTPPRPVPWSRRARADLGMSEKDRDAAVASTASVIALRYRDDWMSPSQRMETIRACFGTAPCETERQGGREVRRCGRLTTVEVDGDRHSVLTEDLDPPARKIVLAFLHRHLG